MFTLLFWKATLERALSTGAQTFIGLTIVANPFDLVNLDWGQIAIASGITTALAVVKALVVAGVTDGSPSIGNAEALQPVNVKSDNGSLAG